VTSHGKTEEDDEDDAGGETGVIAIGGAETVRVVDAAVSELVDLCWCQGGGHCGRGLFVCCGCDRRGVTGEMKNCETMRL
jgi:hypothetical protein